MDPQFDSSRISSPDRKCKLRKEENAGADIQVFFENVSKNSVWTLQRRNGARATDTTRRGTNATGDGDVTAMIAQSEEARCPHSTLLGGTF